MSLEPWSATQVDNWETSLLSAVKNIRDIREVMRTHNLNEIELEAKRANEKIAEIEAWSFAALAKAKKTGIGLIAQRVADRKTQEIKTKTQKKK